MLYLIRAEQTFVLIARSAVNEGSRSDCKRDMWEVHSLLNTRETGCHARCVHILWLFYYIDFVKHIVYSVLPMPQPRLVILKNKETGEVYLTSKNKKKVERKLELKKYSKKLRKHIVFKEVKK